MIHALGYARTAGGAQAARSTEDNQPLGDPEGVLGPCPAHWAERSGLRGAVVCLSTADADAWPDNGAGIEVPAVSAKADGVHVQIEGVAGQKVFFQSDAGLVYPMQLREDGGTFELPLPPGSWHAACGPKGSAPPAPAAGAGFVVGDPASRYVSYQPECPLDETGQQLNGELPSSFVQNQETAIREVLADDGLLDSDLIERAGYVKSIPGEDPPNPMAFRLTRGDTVVGAFEAMEGRDGWTYFMGGCLNSEA